MSYSQNEEEKYILEAVGSQVGTFLDIGAFDGKTFSNTLALIERGWGGMMVEPNPYAFISLMERHGRKKNIVLVQAIVGNSDCLKMLWVTRDAVSTTEKERFEIWRDTAQFEACVIVPQISISLLLGAPEVVSIDTEGTSPSLFEAWPFETCRPKVFCVEFDNSRDAIETVATAEKYRVVYSNDENLVLVRGN